jgi:hypothetical protein
VIYRIGYIRSPYFELWTKNNKIKIIKFPVSCQYPDSTGKCSTAAFGKNLSGGFKTGTLHDP